MQITVQITSTQCHLAASYTNLENFGKCLKVKAYNLGGKFDFDEDNSILLLTETGQRKHSDF